MNIDVDTILVKVILKKFNYFTFDSSSFISDFGKNSVQFFHIILSFMNSCQMSLHVLTNFGSIRAKGTSKIELNTTQNSVL